MWDFLKQVFEFLSVKIQGEFAGLKTNTQQIKELIMGFKEDFAAFQANVQTKFDELNAALTEINTDISSLMAANANTPPEVVQGMQDIQAKLQGLVDAAKVDAALNDGGTPPPDNPPL